MQELHENEQYFFTDDSLKQFSGLLQQYENPAILCAPTLAQFMQQNSSRPICTLDIDTRFAQTLPGFRVWNLYKPTHLGIHFNVIFCDPPFFNCSLSQLFTAIRMLADFNYDQPLMICYLVRREQALLGTFSKFGLKPTGVFASYKTVQNVERNGIQLYANVDLGSKVL